MPILKDISMIYDPLYDVYGTKSIIKSEVHEDPFWDAFEHAVKMVEYFNILSGKKYEYWFEFVDVQEYPTEDELDTFVNICKKGIEPLKGISDCALNAFVNSIENIEGYWPYA